MKKRCLGSLVVLVLVLVAGAALAQPSPPFHILHKQGAIYHYDTGWTLSTPPYYPGSDWAVDFIHTTTGPAILHKDGCIWKQGTGWLMSGYYAGSDYARALDALPDLSGCWCAYNGGWKIWEGATAPALEGQNVYSGYPYRYVEITQTGRGLVANSCRWNGSTWLCGTRVGSVVGDHVILHAGGAPATNDCAWGTELVGRWFWNSDRESYHIQFGATYTNYLCDGTAAGTEYGWFGTFSYFPTYSDDGETWYDCQCPPEF